MLILPEKMKSNAADIADFIDTGQYQDAVKRAVNISNARLAEIVVNADREHMLNFLNALGVHRAALVVAEFPAELAAKFIENAPVETVVEWLTAMPTDIAVDLLSYLSEDESSELIALLPIEIGANIRNLSRYEEGTAGAEMSLFYVAVPEGKKASDVLEAIKMAPSRLSRTGYVYVVDDHGRLVGVVSLRELLMARSNEMVDRIMKNDVRAARVHDSAVETAQRIRDRQLKMMPVITAEDVLVGVITIEDALEILSYDLAEDLSGIGAGSADESFFTPPHRSIRMRLPWMVANIFLNLVAVSIIAGFEGTIAQVAILAAFLPMITDMGGNVGIQALSVSIRSIALGEARITDYLTALKKEALIGVCNGIVLGCVFGTLAYLFEGNIILGLVAGIALCVNVFVAGVVGGTIPFLIKHFGKDPAMMTGPILTTITDITGVSIYLGLCTIFLTGLI